MREQNIDLIGDIHGQFDALLEMLGELGYSCTDGQWKHSSSHHLIFLGDLIDRGKKNRAVVNTVRDLTDQNLASCLMGNHEFNAVQYHTEHPTGSGYYLRKHEGHNIKQHQSFLDEYAGHEDELNDVIAWFSKLPVAIETPFFRAIHACWSPEHLKNIQHQDDAWYLGDTPWISAADKSATIYETVEILLKGPEKTLPGGLFFKDKGGKERKKARLAWWKKHPKCWAEAVDSEVMQDELHHHAWDADFHSYSREEKPVFFGHYWRTGPIEQDAPNAFCLDYSAGNDGHLTTYRFNTEQTFIDEDHIVQIKV